MKEHYYTEPEKVKYEPLPDGTANVYLRRDIKQETETYQDGEGGTGKRTAWTAEETHLITTATKEEVEKQFDDLVLSNGKQPTVEERVTALEEAVLAIVGGE